MLLSVIEIILKGATCHVHITRFTDPPAIGIFKYKAGAKKEKFALPTHCWQWWCHSHHQSPPITSNLLRALQTLFGLEIQSQRFYTFMASATLPWKSLWRTMWGLIDSPATEERILVAPDDSINPKSGRKIFGCGHFHDHATKGTPYPWSQCILAIGLLKKVKSRWACLPLVFRFYIMKKDIEIESTNVKQKGKVIPFESKMIQAASMLKEVQSH